MENYSFVLQDSNAKHLFWSVHQIPAGPKVPKTVFNTG